MLPANFIRSELGRLRSKLVDTTGRTSLISFKHSTRSRRCIRVIDELPNQLYNRLNEDQVFRFKSLGEPDTEPTDEKRVEFRRALDAAKLEDTVYLEALRNAPEEPSERLLQKLETELRGRVREKLGMRPRDVREVPSLEEVAKRLGLDPSFDLPAPNAAGAKTRHGDAYIQTLMFTEPLERTLGSLKQHVRTSLEETGVNPLFSVFGFLEWYDSDETTVAVHSPLLLLPLEIDRELTGGRYQYQIRSTGEGALVNVALDERLKKSFEMPLPAFEEEDTPEDYLSKVQTAIAAMRNWRVRRWITVGLFNFARIAMYHDLGALQEAEDEDLLGRKTMSRLLGQGNSEAQAPTPEELARTPGVPTSNEAITVGEEHAQTAHEVDPVELSVPLITDADSSQLQVITEAMAGRSMVVEGPPGTGKSQTITNIIAAAVSKGMKVLFIAEKMAALNVVRNRLESAGLGEFCFELHSNKAGRKETFAAIGRRLGRKKSGSVDNDLRSIEGMLTTSRKELSALVESLSAVSCSLGVTNQRLLWRVHEVRAESSDLAPELDDIWLGHAAELSQVDVDRILETATRWQEVRASIEERYGSARNNPWFGLANKDLNLLSSDQVITRIRKMGQSASTAVGLKRQVHQLINWEPTILAEFTRVGSAADLQLPKGGLRADVFERLYEPQLLATTDRFVAQVEEFREKKAALSKACDGDLTRANAEGLERAARSNSKAFAPSTSVAHLQSQLKAIDKSAKAFGTAVELLSTVKLQLQRCVDPSLIDRLSGAMGEQALILGASLAALASHSVMKGRTATLVSQEAPELLAKARAGRDSLLAARSRLSSEFVLQDCPEAADLRRFAKGLRAAPFIPFLSSDYRKARKAWKGIRKNNPSFTRQASAAALEELATFLDDSERYRKSPPLLQVLGKSELSLDEDLMAAQAVADWAQQVTSECHLKGPCLEVIRDILLSGPLTALEVLQSLAKNSLYSLAQSLSQEAAKHGCSIEEFALKRVQQFKHGESVLADLIRAGVGIHIEMKELEGLSNTFGRALALQGAINENSEMRSLLGAAFQGADTDLLVPRIASTLAHEVLNKALPPEIARWVFSLEVESRLSSLRSLAERCATVAIEVQRAFEALTAVHVVNLQSWLKVGALPDADVESLSKLCNSCSTDAFGLEALVQDERVAEEVKKDGLAEVLAMVEGKGVPAGRFVSACRRVLYQSIARTVFSSQPPLLRFSGDQHEKTRARFADLDRKIQVLRRKDIANKLLSIPIPSGNDRGPKSTWSNLALVTHVTGLQRPRTSIRSLINQAGTALQALMPCFMMSPLSVAQYLPATMKFDMIIMDEASQLRPEDAVGAIARGQQVIIVGDPKQLPPTSFFWADSSESVNEDEDETVASEKSILDGAMAILRPMKRLTWHYRSRHASLIAYSNLQFYNNELVAFPSPRDQAIDLGVRYVKVADGCYHRGGSINPPEAVCVAKAVLQQVRDHPERSLGVVALNIKQAELLRLEIDRLAMEDGVFESWRRSREGTLEPFFVKNLENVQGDERDVIFISTVYGRDESGNIHQRFGPINNEGGHRRLNVLFTRSKLQTVIFSTLDPGDIRVDEKSRDGVRALQGYLRYARDGILENSIPTGRPAANEFEKSVGKALESAGFTVIPQVGVVGYFIDMGVRHPERPGDFVLGVECDGATYHGTKSARDRDRLRQEILERLGWRIHRIWSVDWFRDPTSETRRLIAATRSAIASAASFTTASA